MTTPFARLLFTFAIGTLLAVPATASQGCGTASDPYAGHYRLADGGELHLFQLGNRYHASSGNGRPVEVTQVAHGRFASRHGALQLDFCTNADGRDAELVVTRRAAGGRLVQQAGRPADEWAQAR